MAVPPYFLERSVSMRILCIGDVVRTVGCDFLREKLPKFKREHKIDLTIVNGENSAEGNGIHAHSLQYLLDSGADVVTTGNHSFRQRGCETIYEDCEILLRPANFPAGTTPGRGLCIVDMGRVRVAVINLMGTVYLESMRCPFETLEKILKTPDLPKIRIVDFHAEATGEKRAMGYFADGKISALFGTHTHVPTADECILPHGTGYITDVGMTGPINSVLGVKSENVIQKLTTKLPVRFDPAEPPCRMDCVIFDIDEKTGLCTGVERTSVY